MTREKREAIIDEAVRNQTNVEGRRAMDLGQWMMPQTLFRIQKEFTRISAREAKA